MKRLLKLAVVAVASLSLVTASFAQAAGPRTGGQGSGNRMFGGRGQSEVVAKLNLSQAQKTKVDALNKKTQASMQKVMQDSKLTREAKQKKAQEIMTAHQKSFSAILTASQKKIYDAEMKKMADQRASGFGGRGLGGGQIMSKLNLSQAQKTKVEALNKKTQASMQKVQQDTKLDQAAKRKKYQDIMASHEKSLLAILTAAQKKTYEAEKKKMQTQMQNRQRTGGGGRTGGGRGG